MKFEVWKSVINGQWYWRLRSTNGKIVAQSEGYTRKRSALDTIISIKSSARGAKLDIQS